MRFGRQGALEKVHRTEEATSRYTSHMIDCLLSESQMVLFLYFSACLNDERLPKKSGLIQIIFEV